MSVLQLKRPNTLGRVSIYRYVAVIQWKLQRDLLQKAEEISGLSIHENVHANVNLIKVSKPMHAKANQRKT